MQNEGAMRNIGTNYYLIGAMIFALPALAACEVSFPLGDRSLPKGCLSAGQSVLDTFGGADAELTVFYDFTDWEGGEDGIFPGHREAKTLISHMGGGQQALKDFIESKDRGPTIFIGDRSLFRIAFGPGNPHDLLNKACHRYGDGVTMHHLVFSRG
jgi:hypothetical protein